MAQHMVGRGDDVVPMVGCKRVSDGSKAHVDGTSGTPFLFAIHRVEAENALGAPRQASVDVEVVEVGETGTNLNGGVECMYVLANLRKPDGPPVRSSAGSRSLVPRRAPLGRGRMRVEWRG